MDPSIFSSNEFDSKDWINSILQPENCESQDLHVI